jgi:hypothetical protein
MAGGGSWFQNNWKWLVLFVLFLLLGLWQTCTYFYLRDDLGGWLNEHGGGDGTTPPKPPPRF